MMKRRTVFGLAPVLALAVLLAATSHAEKCETIRFKRGESSGTVRGMAPPNDVICYQMSTGAGQTASLAIPGNKGHGNK